MKIYYSSFLFKFIGILVPLVLLIPISTIENFYAILFVLNIIILSEPKFKIYFTRTIIIIFCLILSFFYLDTAKINIGKGLIILNENSKNFYKDNLPIEILNFFSEKFKFYEKNSTCSKEDFKCWRNFDPDLENVKFESHQIITSKEKNQFYRNNNLHFVKDLNIKNLKDIKLNEINSLRYNYFYLQKYDLIRENIPYYIVFSIPKYLINSELCWKGNIFWEANNYNFNKYYNKNKSCKLIQSLDVGKLIFGVSLGSSENVKELKWLYGQDYINVDDNLYTYLKENKLEIEIKKNNKIVLKESIINISKFLFLIIFIYALFNFNIKIFIFSIFFPLLFLLILKIINTELLNGFNIYTGGNDGILYDGYGTKLYNYLKSYNIYEFFRGVESVFYFPSSIRYFFAINKFIFDHSTYGYILIGYVIIFILFFIFKNLFGFRYSLFFLFLFTITRVFEGYTFSMHTFLQHINEADAEPLAIFLFLISLYLFINNFNKKKTNSMESFMIGFFAFLSLAIRPNYFPSSFLLVTLYFYFSYIKYKNFNAYFSLIGFSFLLLIPFHNLYYGNSLVLFSSGVHHNTNVPIHIYLNSIIDLLSLNFSSDNLKIIFNQIFEWIKPHEIHYLISFTLILLVLFYKNINLIFKLISLLAISQHLVLLMFEPANRYAYLAWLLTFIVLCYFIIIIIEWLYSNIKRRL